MAPSLVNRRNTLAEIKITGGETTPKTMSSRLMTMKFMQRAAAGGNSASTSTPASPTSPAAAANNDENNTSSSNKRRKTIHVLSVASESPGTPLYDQKVMQEALAEEDRKRQAAIERRALELGDSRWVLHHDEQQASDKDNGGKKHGLLDVMQVGFAQVDREFPRVAESDESSFEENEEDEADDTSMGIRKFNMEAITKGQNDNSGENSNSDAGSSDNDDDEGEELAVQQSASNDHCKKRYTKPRLGSAGRR